MLYVANVTRQLTIIGICGCARNLDEAFGRIDVADKTIKICLKIMAEGVGKQTPIDENFFY